MPETTPSLGEHHASVAIPARAPTWRRWFAVAGPALLVSVGYMDPGNWATDLAGGSRYEYALLWVLLMSNLMAMLLQSLAARLGIVRRRDLAQACRERFPRPVNLALYLMAEIAIIATDLAEVLGSAIALQLLFGLPLLWGVALTTLDVLLLLALSNYGIRWLEGLILSFVVMIGGGFIIQIWLAQPDWGEVAKGLVPSLPDSGALYIAVGILGATVMPHNLYLHSALVQTRRTTDAESIRQAVRLNTLDSILSLNLAFLVNAAILIMAAAVFYRAGVEVAEIQDAYRLLEPLLGSALAPLVFALALLAAGQSSTITATLAGQIVMEGFLNIRIRPWLRRLITRLLAAAPAVVVIQLMGEEQTGELLVLSQVVLSLQLPFAVIPLIHFVSDREAMGAFVAGRLVRLAAWLVAALIVGLNLNLALDEIAGWTAADPTGPLALLLYGLLAVVLLLLAYVTFEPVLARWRGRRVPARSIDIHGEAMPHLTLPEAAPAYRRVAVALDFTGGEERLLAEALRQLAPEGGELLLFHVAESPVARAYGAEAEDYEVARDRRRLEALAQALGARGLKVRFRLGRGDPQDELVRLCQEEGVELLVMGAHGHRGVEDVLYGSTVSGLRHRLAVPVLVVPLAAGDTS